MRKWAQHPGVCLSWASIACRIVQTLPSNLCRQAYQAAGVSSDDSLKASYWNSEDLIAYVNNLSVTFIHCPLIDFRKSLSCILSILQFITLSLWGLRGYSGSYVEANAFDGDANTPWVSACSSCAIGEALIGIVGVFLAANQTFRSTLKVGCRGAGCRDSKVQSRGGPLHQAPAMHCGTRRLWLSADGLTNAACVAACKGTRSETSEEFEWFNSVNAWMLFCYSKGTIIAFWDRFNMEVCWCIVHIDLWI